MSLSCLPPVLPNCMLSSQKPLLYVVCKSLGGHYVNWSSMYCRRPGFSLARMGWRFCIAATDLRIG